MKKVLVWLLVACAAMALTGCSLKERRPKMDIEVKDGKTVYDGEEQYFYQVEEGTVGTLHVKVRTESGEISLKIFRTDDRSKVAYQGNAIPTSEFDVVLEEIGEYKVWVEADDFVGSYGFEYSKTPAADTAEPGK